MIPISPSLRPDTFDAKIWKCVFDDNEYHLRSDLSGKYVIDVGGHIGSFSCACASRGAESVSTFEASTDNFEVLKQNVGQFSAISPNNKAVAAPGVTRLYFSAPTSGNTGAGAVSSKEAGVAVDCTSLADVIAGLPSRHADLVKLDCEGAEWQILSTASTDVFMSVTEFIGEFHISEEATKLGHEVRLPSSSGFSSSYLAGRIDIAPRLWLQNKFEAHNFNFWSGLHPFSPRLGWFYAAKKGATDLCVDNFLTQFHLEDTYRHLYERVTTLTKQRVHRDGVIEKLKKQIGGLEKTEQK